MRHDTLGEVSLDYSPCRYGNSRLFFRGPRRPLDGPYVAFVGGSETYGKFVDRPFPALVEDDTGLTCVNLGCMHASIEAFVQEPAVWTACHDAVLSVVQVTGAHNMSNRFYSVHPRRNDRFLRASTVLQALYPEVDFTEFCFTRHMLSTLHGVSADRFGILRAELQTAWSARMARFLAEIGPRTILLWYSESLPSDLPWEDRPDPFGAEPLFIQRGMIEALRPTVRAVVMAQPSARARAAGTAGMVFGLSQSTSVTTLPNALAHRDVADALLPQFRLAFGAP